MLAGQGRGAGRLGRRGPDQRGDRPGVRGLLDLDLAADAVHPQVSHDRLDRLGLGVQPDLAGAQPQDPHVGLHVPLAVEQGRVTALVRSHGVEVVGQLALEELGGVGPLDEHDSAPAAEEAGLLSQGAVLAVQLDREAASISIDCRKASTMSF